MSALDRTFRTAAGSTLGTDAAGRLVVRRARLVVVQGPDAGAAVALDEGAVLVGSGPEADLRLSDAHVSSMHAEIAFVGRGVRVRDLGSTNGTFAGELRVESAVLQPGGRLRVGRTLVAIEACDEPAEVPAYPHARFGGLVGQSPAMRALFGMLAAVAPTDVPVVVQGERGTGKALAARAVHEHSPRAGGPLVTLEVRAAEPAQVASAARDAEGGTLLIRRVEEATAPVLAALVAALEHREQGAHAFRPIATCRADFDRFAQRGRRETDLYFHLAAVRVQVPPVRDRREDLPLLVADVARGLRGGDMWLPREAIEELTTHPLDGNVRELGHVLELVARPMAGDAPVEELASRVDLPMHEAKARAIEGFTRAYVRALLLEHGGNVSRAAEAAGITRQYLTRLVSRYDRG